MHLFLSEVSDTPSVTLFASATGAPVGTESEGISLAFFQYCIF